MPEPTQDANTASDSSTTQTEQTTGATQEGASPSTQTPEAALDAGLASIVDKAMEKHSDSSPESDKEQKKEEAPPSEEGTKPELEVKKEEVEKSVETQVQEDGQAKGPVPLERFQKVYATSKEYERQLEQTKPIVTQYTEMTQYLQDHNVPQEDLNLALSFIAAANTNPVEALKLIEPMLSRLKSVTGEELPDELKKAVEAGEMTEQWAKKLAATQGQKKVSEVEWRRQQDAQLKQRSQENLLANQNAVNAWQSAKQKLNPDFKPSNDPQKKGIYELMSAYASTTINEMVSKGKSPSTQELIAVLEEAYKDAQGTIGLYTKSTSTRSTPSSTRSASSTTKPINSPTDLQQAVLAKYG